MGEDERPGRMRDRMLEEGPSSGWMHIDDAASATVAAIERGEAGSHFKVCGPGSDRRVGAAR